MIDERSEWRTFGDKVSTDICLPALCQIGGMACAAWRSCWQPRITQLPAQLLPGAAARNRHTNRPGSSLCFCVLLGSS